MDGVEVALIGIAQSLEDVVQIGAERGDAWQSILILFQERGELLRLLTVEGSLGYLTLYVFEKALLSLYLLVVCLQELLGLVGRLLQLAHCRPLTQQSVKAVVAAADKQVYKHPRLIRFPVNGRTELFHLSLELFKLPVQMFEALLRT